MPVIKKIDDGDWINDEPAVKAFLVRLDLVIVSTSGVDTRMAVDMRNYVRENQRFSSKQSWALSKLEEKVEEAERRMHTQVDWFDTPPQIDTQDDRYYGSPDDTR